jgi:hypothetical protein
MGVLSATQFETLRALVEGAPDAALRNLETAMASDQAGSAALSEIRQLIALEAIEREAGARVLGPLLPLCRETPDPLSRLSFPAAAPKLVWRALKTEEPRLAGLARDTQPDEDDPFFAVDDELCRSAAAGLRVRSGAYAPAVDALDAATAGGSVQFAACLDLAPIARRAIARLPDWMGRLTEERSAAARLAFKDSVALAEDNGPRLFELLIAHLDEPWQVLRLISAVMDRPGDQFVAASELASFGERLLDDIDQRVADVIGFSVAGGREAGAAAGRAVHVATMEISAFDESLEISRQGPWGQRLMAQKRMLAAAVENRIKAVETTVAAALPLQSGRKRTGPRGHPRLTQDPDRNALIRAEALTAFMPEVRSASAVGGFGAIRAQVADAVEARLSQYVEDLLETIHLQAPEAGRARLYLDAAAELLGLLTGSKAAQLVRRRAAAA